MKQYSNLSRVMEPETISKNGASSKSQTSRGNFLKKACFGLLTAGIIFFSVNAYTGDSAQSSGSNTQSERWEYKMLELDNVYKRKFPSKEAALNDLGAEGWELVSVTQTGSSHYQCLYIFKRRLP